MWKFQENSFANNLVPEKTSVKIRSRYTYTYLCEETEFFLLGKTSSRQPETSRKFTHPPPSLCVRLQHPLFFENSVKWRFTLTDRCLLYQKSHFPGIVHSVRTSASNAEKKKKPLKCHNIGRYTSSSGKGKDGRLPMSSRDGELTHLSSFSQKYIIQDV